MRRWVSLIALITCSSAYADGHGIYLEHGDGSRTAPCCGQSTEPFKGTENRPFTSPAVSRAAVHTPMLIAVESPAEGEFHFADVTIHNRLVFADTTHTRYDFQIKGEVVIVVPEPRSGNDPDTFTVIPPDGYIAVPDRVTLEEGENAVIKIFSNLLG